MTDKADKDHPVVHVRCRRGQDQLTSGQECGSLQAYNLSSPGGPVVRLKCVKCGYIWATPVGGPVSF